MAFKFNAVWPAVDTGLLASLVLVTLPRPTIAFVTPVKLPLTSKLVNEPLVQLAESPINVLALKLT